MKNQIKKSLSLIMAVLMLMSCWVWVAPTEASAATQDYYVKVKYEIRNSCETGGHIKIYYWNFNANGTVNTGSGGNKVLVNSLKDVSTGTYEKDTTVPGFPYRVELYADGGSWGEGKVAINAITVGDRVVSGNLDAIEAHDQTKNFGINTSGGKDGDWERVTIDWPFPKFGLDEANSATPLDLNGIPSSATASFSFIDVNYNTAWPHTVTQNTPSVILQKDGLSKTGMTASKGTGNTTTVSASTGADQHNPGNTDSSWTLKASFTSGGVTVTPTVDVTLAHPEYEITFDANGGKLDASDAAAQKGVYGAKIGHVPTMYDYKGYQLEGFRTGKDSGTVLTADTLITGNQTWYAWWSAKDVNATFQTADGQFIGTLTGKYGTTLQSHFGSLGALNQEIEKTATGIPFVNHEPVWSKDGLEYQFAGWRVIQAWDLDGKEITALNGQKQDTAVLQGDVVLQATYVPKDKKQYTVSFYDETGAQLSTKSDYTYGQDAVQPASPDLEDDVVYEYAHVGWAPKIGNTKFYKVDAENKDENGALVIYVSKDADTFPVQGNAEYVPVFQMINKKYTISFIYYEDNHVEKIAKVEGLHYGDDITVPKDVKNSFTYNGSRYNFDYWYNVDTADRLEDSVCVGNMTFKMEYMAPILAIYTINFYDRDGKTVLNADSNQYEHESKVTAPEVETVIDTKEARYTFDAFRDAEGNKYSTSATADVNYYAIYTQRNFADVKFYNYDGTLLYEHKGNENETFVNDPLPEYKNIQKDEDGNEVNVLPEREEDPIGKYKFIGWATKDGTIIDPSTYILSGDLELYAQYKTEFNEYTVKFINENEVVSERPYHYGDPIVIPENEPTKAPDETYTYEFRAWSPDVSEVCYGNATYEATYRRTYNYYQVTWMDDNKEIISVSNYRYGSKIQQGIINNPAGYPDASAGHEWVFSHWVQCDANGNDILVNGEQVKFTRGMKMGATPLYFYPVFKEVADVLTVNFYQDDGKTSISTVDIEYGKDISTIADAATEKAAKEPTAATHSVVVGWVTVDTEIDYSDEEYLENIDFVSSVTTDISVKPVYKTEAHMLFDYDVLKEPTCTDTGLANIGCTTDGCGYVAKNQIIDIIPDDEAPTGQVSMGTNIEIDGVKYVNANTKIIVSAEDRGSLSKLNPLATLSRGVDKIEYYVSTEVADPTGITSNWTKVYDSTEVKADILSSILKDRGITVDEYNALSYDEKAEIDNEVKAIFATYNANATGALSNLNLTDGEDYIIYIKISDIDPDGDGPLTSNIGYINSGMFFYGTTAPVIAVEGYGSAAKFCKDAVVTVKVTDDTDGLSVSFDGAPVTLDAEGKFVCDTAGVHTVVAIDKNGNSTVKTFEIKSEHTFKTYIIGATCETEGSEYKVCTVCGFKEVVKTIPAKGHTYISYTEQAPTCELDGSRTYVCDNNCGKKLVLKADSSDAEIAQASKFVEGENGERVRVPLTAEDLQHLKSKGEHTYAKVKDENGEDTDVDEWIIDKVSTCSEKGSRHRDCIVCGVLGREIDDEVDYDTSLEGHNFYMAKITTPATCTTDGEKTKACKNCPYVHHVETIPAFGHTAGEYDITLDATCTAEGSKILICATCEVAIGEPVLDEKDNVIGFNGEAVVIPALGHAWIIDGDPVKEDDVWYQYYKCAHKGCNEKDKKELPDYVEPVAVQVKFMNGENDAAPIVIDKYVGETITSDLVADPAKAEDATYKYTFAYWATKNADDTYTKVKFPISVTENTTYYAVYNEKYINYTITYYGDDMSTEYKKTGYLHNGETVTLIENGPAKAEDEDNNIYEFVGWQQYVDKLDENGDVVTDNNGNPIKELKDVTEIVINGSNVRVFAKYAKSKKQFAITFAYSKSNIISTFLVDAGLTVGRVNADKIFDFEPVKKYDTKYHYEFTGWNRENNQTKLITVNSNIYTTPNFEPILHQFTVSEKTPASCGIKAEYTYTCSCGYSYDASSADDEVLSHSWNVAELNTATGKYEKTCSICGITTEETSKYTAYFYLSEEDMAAEKIYDKAMLIEWGQTIPTTDLPAVPKKATDSTNTYKFSHWVRVGTDETYTTDELANIVIKADEKFVAVFTATVREYNVYFVYEGDKANVISYKQNVKAGSNVTFEGTTVPTKAYNDNYHYTFKGWKDYEAGKLNITVENVQSDVYVYAQFTATKHTYDAGVEVSHATCTQAPGYKYTCTGCERNYTKATGKPLDHTWVEVERKEATANKNGYIKYECDTCDNTKEETLKYESNAITVSVTVLCNGVADSGKQVIVMNTESGETKFVTTNANGLATAEGIKGESYAAWVVIDGVQIQIELNEDSKGNLSATYKYEIADTDCTCACHRTNVWGAIFRFFHKIIKMFTGEFKCCGNPDELYGE